MTGWAVVHGRNDVPISTRRDLDTWYADHAGFVLDLKILCKTIATGRGWQRNQSHRRPTTSGRIAGTRSGGSAMFNGKLGALLPFDEAALPLVQSVDQR